MSRRKRGEPHREFAQEVRAAVAWQESGDLETSRDLAMNRAARVLRERKELGLSATEALAVGAAVAMEAPSVDVCSRAGALLDVARPSVVNPEPTNPLAPVQGESLVQCV